MAEIPKIVLPHGGYKKLIVYRKSEVIYQGTVAFCRRFLAAFGDRTVDQMTQAARSCKQNIAEGSASSGTSKETELKLTNVARATLDELLEDYKDFLTKNGYSEWPDNDKRKIFAREFAKEHNDWPDWKEICETRPADALANLMLVVIYQTRYLIDRMISQLEEDFTKQGGIRERMHAARTAQRGEEFEKGLYSYLSAAKTPEELAAKISELNAQIDRTAFGLRRKRSWT